MGRQGGVSLNLDERARLHDHHLYCKDLHDLTLCFAFSFGFLSYFLCVLNFAPLHANGRDWLVRGAICDCRNSRSGRTAADIVSSSHLTHVLVGVSDGEIA